MMEKTKVKSEKPPRKEYIKVIETKLEEKDGNELSQFDLSNLAKISFHRYIDRKRNLGIVFSRRKRPTQKFFRKIVFSYIKCSLDELVDKGEVYFLSKRLYIERIISKRNLEWDKKWNGNQYLVFLDTTITRRKKVIPKKIRFEIGKEYLDKIYKKVKDNWNYYEQQFHFRNS